MGPFSVVSKNRGDIDKNEFRVILTCSEGLRTVLLCP